MKLKAYVDETDENTKDIDALYFDGYSIGERQLEGVIVKITLNAAKNDIVVSADWPKGLDKTFWAKEAKRMALENDVFCTTPELNDDDGFIDHEDGQ